MRTDALFGEFVYEVYRMKKILGERAIENRDLNDFFDEKAVLMQRNTHERTG